MTYHTIYRNIAVSGVMAGVLVASVPGVLAHEGMSSQNFCAQLTQIQSRTGNWAENYGEVKEDRHGEKMIRRHHRWSQQDAEKQKRRADKEVRREKRFDRLEAKATTDAQKQAVATFKVAVQTAVDIRQTEINKAVADFRAGVASASGAYQTSIDAAIATFTTKANAAFAKAQADCTSGKDVATIQNELKTSLKAAKDQMKASVKAVPVPEKVEALREVRKTAVHNAITKFKTAFTAARIVLEAALK